MSADILNENFRFLHLNLQDYGDYNQLRESGLHDNDPFLFCFGVTALSYNWGGRFARNVKALHCRDFR